MEGLFISVINMSITASFLVLAVVLIRALFRRAPRWTIVLLWALVGIRLVSPFSFQSVWSVIPTTEAISPDAISTPVEMNTAPSIEVTFPFVSAIDPVQTMLSAATIVWLFGMIGMLIYAIVSYVRLRCRLQEAVKKEGNVWMCDRIDTSFILGAIRPKIYVPSNVQEQELTYILAHERAHLRRGDHLWKPIGFLLLSVHCFNPLMWVAYVLLCRDIEIACDEKVIGELGENGKRAYAETLICQSVQRHLITACPLAFGETAIKERVASVLSFRKPTVWILLAALVVSVIVAVCFMTDPHKESLAVNTPTVTTTTQTRKVTTTARSATTHTTTVYITTTTVASTTTTVVRVSATVAPTTAAPIVTASPTTAAPITMTVTTATPTTTMTAVPIDENTEVQILSVTPYEVCPGSTVTVKVKVNSRYDVQSMGLHLYRGKPVGNLNTVYDTATFHLTEGDGYNGIYTATYTISKAALPMPWYLGIGGTKLDHSTVTSDYPYPKEIPIMILPSGDEAHFVVTE